MRERPAVPYPTSIERAFRRFHTENPEVYRELVALAWNWRARGHSVCGIGMLFEVLRWRRGMRTQGDEFKLNNNYRSRYARLIMEREQDLKGMFNLREIQRD